MCYDLLRFSLCSGICAASRVIFPYRKSCRVCCHDLSPPKLLLHTQFTTSCVFDAKRIKHAHVHFMYLLSIIPPLRNHEVPFVSTCNNRHGNSRLFGPSKSGCFSNCSSTSSDYLRSGLYRPLRLGFPPGYLCLGRLRLCKLAYSTYVIFDFFGFFLGRLIRLLLFRHAASGGLRKYLVFFGCH